MLPKDLYSKWDDRDKSEAEINTENDAVAKIAVKPVDGVETKAKRKSILLGPGDTKGENAAEAAKEKESKHCLTICSRIQRRRKTQIRVRKIREETTWPLIRGRPFSVPPR
ncbi:hypothetical protein N7G274_006847 [Stereocaulon virgatum]|uniref:Uncharacterized protein n=1 Tax=Stereocaulon virgatum TaxID=373712 RepID=A0ABR4A4H2_9LECA